MPLLNCIKYTILFSFQYMPCSSWPWSWSHQQRNLLNPYLLSDCIHISNIGRPAMYSAIVSCRLLTHSPTIHNPVTFIAVATGGHSHSLVLPHLAVSPKSLRSTLWWKPFSTVMQISGFKCQLLNFCGYKHVVWEKITIRVWCPVLVWRCLYAYGNFSCMGTNIYIPTSNRSKGTNILQVKWVIFNTNKRPY